MISVQLSALADYIPDASLFGKDVLIERCSFDSRKVQAGDLFIALKGERFDAHDFLESVVEADVSAVLVSKKVDLNVSQIVVPDTQLALAYIGAYNRDQFKGKIVGLTGSAGKTSSKEMISCVLSEAGKVVATKGNLNNEIGVPQTLLELNDEFDFAVVEMGAAKALDISYLMKFVRPNVGVLLNALPAHIEGFGSIECVAKTKSEVVTCLEAGSTAVINLDTPYSKEWINETEVNSIVAYSLDAGKYIESDQYQQVIADKIELNPLGSSFELVCGGLREKVVLNVSGLHNVSNALAAASAGMSLGVSLKSIAKGLSKFSAVAGRMSRHEGLAGSLIIDDSYNANPQAMKQAIEVLAAFDGTKILVMGDMGELGPKEKEIHKECGAYAQNKVDAVWTVGRLSEQAASGFGEGAKHFASQQDLIDFAKKELDENYILLVKGSRVSKMDLVVKQLYKKES